jgi:hypothetical protein
LVRLLVPLGLLALLLLGACSGEEIFRAPDATVEPFVSTEPLQRGINFACWERYCYGNLEVEPSVDTLASYGVSHACLLFSVFTASSTSSTVERDSFLTQDDLIVPLLRTYTDPAGLELAMRVNVYARDGSWPGSIRPDDPEAWFDSFREIAVHYARIAERHDVGLLFLGNELVGLEPDGPRWRALVDSVRAVYSGKVTYAANWATFQQVPFWDAMDYVGVNAYFPLCDSTSPGTEELKEAWKPWLERLRGTADRARRPVLLTEIGYSSTRGSCAEPYVQFPGPFVDVFEQADAYEAALGVLPSQPWLAGIYWWYWQADDLQWGGYHDKGYSPQNKPAGEVLRTAYRRMHDG